jgi:hypothetical protein
MNIAVFGDSYAEKNAGPTAWWQVLKQYGHQVTSFGEGGSSINFSAKLILEKYKDFDFIIWCMTTPGRFSVEIHGRPKTFHSAGALTHTGVKLSKNIPDGIDNEIINICQLYLKYVFDPDLENLLGKALANYFLQLIPNLMIIPCFPPPLKTNFDLYNLCTQELQQVFPNMETHNIYESWIDIRTCHMTLQNNQILAEIIANNLKPGIFSTDYSNFNFENITTDQLVKAKLVKAK